MSLCFSLSTFVDDDEDEDDVDDDDEDELLDDADVDGSGTIEFALSPRSFRTSSLSKSWTSFSGASQISQRRLLGHSYRPGQNRQ